MALPKREFMDRAREIWLELGLPDFRPQAPWHGYSLGDWPDVLHRMAKLAVAGEYEKVGETVEKQRRSDVEMNQPVRV